MCAVLNGMATMHPSPPCHLGTMYLSPCLFSFSTAQREPVPEVLTIKIYKEMFNEIVSSSTDQLQQHDSATSAGIFHLMRK